MAALDRAENGQAMPVVQGIPVQPAPGVIGLQIDPVPVTMLDLPIQVVLSYRTAVTCFAVLDIAFTVLNVVAAYATGLVWNWWQLLFLVFLLGPLCGVLGASWLRRELVGVYLAFCIVKTCIQLYSAIFGFFLWAILFVFSQIWITKIVATFCYFLGRLSPIQRQMALDAKDYEVQRVYW